MAMRTVASLGLSGSIGVLLGVALVTWVQPTTMGGSGLLVLVPVLICTVIGGVIVRLRK